MITGDRSFGSGNPRFELQRPHVEELVVVYWGRGRFWPHIPAGHFDVVTVQDPFWRGIFAWIVARRMGTKFNVQVHTDLSAQTFFRRFLAKIVLRHADSARVVSEKIKKQIRSFGITVPIFVLPVYVDVKSFQNIPRHPHSKKTVLWIGRFEAEKDPFHAIHVLRKVRATGIDAILILLGAGNLEKELRRLSEGLPVEFPGWQHPASYLGVADVVLSTSKHESYGVSIIEALAAGVPVVATDVGIAREAGADIVERGKLAEKVVEILHSGKRGELKLALPSAQEWGEKWRETL